MSEHPEFPQESPAIKYIVEQVSMVQDASSCTAGYYKSLGQVIARLDKTDVALNQLKDTTVSLKKIMDADAVMHYIGKKSDEINQTLKESMAALLSSNINTISTSLAEIERKNRELCNGHILVLKEIQETSNKLNKEIASLKNHQVILTWKLWGYLVLTLIVGIGVQRYLL